MFANFWSLGELPISVPTGYSPNKQFQNIWEQQVIQKWEDGIKSESYMYSIKNNSFPVSTFPSMSPTLSCFLYSKWKDGPTFKKREGVEMKENQL